MTGSTIKRGNTWTAYWFTTDPASGRRRQHSKGGFRIQKDARSHLNGIMEAVGQGVWRPDAKMTAASSSRITGSGEALRGATAGDDRSVRQRHRRLDAPSPGRARRPSAHPGEGRDICALSVDNPLTSLGRSPGAPTS